MQLTEKWINYVLNSELVIHLIMFAAAAASFSNVHEFFGIAHNSSLLANALGMTLGLILIVLASKLARTPMRWDSWDYRIIASATILTGLLSGSIQTNMYSLHLVGFWPAALGFGIPMVF